MERWLLDKVSQVRKLALLNSSILTAYGSYDYEPLSLEQARALVKEFQEAGRSIESAIGHQSTAEFLSMLLKYEIGENRKEFKQTRDDVALVFKLNSRPGEGKVLTREELDAIGYEFGLLRRID